MKTARLTTLSKLAYPILQKVAENRRVVSYDELADKMGTVGQALGPLLDHTKEWCDSHGYPPLHVLVVRKHTMIPSPRSFSKFPPNLNWDSMRNEVYYFRWHAVEAPWQWLQLIETDKSTT